MDLATLIAREEIRDLVLTYCRGVDQGDLDLVRSLYTEDAVDEHGEQFNGPAGAYVDWLATVLPSVDRMTHHVSNHLIAVDGDRAEGEVYVTAWHRLPGGELGRWHVGSLRYLDHYRRDEGRWRFAKRHVLTDWAMIDAVTPDDPPFRLRDSDPSYSQLANPLFARGARN